MALALRQSPPYEGEVYQSKPGQKATGRVPADAVGEASQSDKEGQLYKERENDDACSNPGGWRGARAGGGHPDREPEGYQAERGRGEPEKHAFESGLPSPQAAGNGGEQR